MPALLTAWSIEPNLPIAACATCPALAGSPMSPATMSSVGDGAKPVTFPQNPEGLDSLQRGSGAHGGNRRDPAVDQEVCPDDIRRIVRREVDRQLRDFQRIGDPLAWIVGSEDALDGFALLFAWEATEHRGVRRTWA